jgi:hypothetical protein
VARGPISSSVGIYEAKAMRGHAFKRYRIPFDGLDRGVGYNSLAAFQNGRHADFFPLDRNLDRALS